MEKNRERERKLYVQLYVNATFNCFDCKQTPPPNSKVKGASKAKPHSMRITRLESSIINISSNQEVKETLQDNKDDDLKAPQNTKSRDSTTNRQLCQKALCDQSLPTQEYIR